MKTFIHPETLEGEVFLTNASSEEFAKILLTSKRKGEISYDGNGNSLDLNDWFPVFISTSELERKGIPLADLRKYIRESIMKKTSQL